MRKLVLGLIFLFIIYLGVQWSFIYFSKGHTLNYEITTRERKFQVQEIFKANQSVDRDNYYLKISYNDTTFTYQVFDDFDKKNKIINDIYYYEDEENKCILPVFSDNQFIFDVTCYDGNIFNYYHNMSDVSDELKSFIKNLEKIGYLKFKFKDSNKVLHKSDMLTIYNNLVNGNHIGLSTYKGLSLINKNNTIRNIDIFSMDTYQRTISAFTNNFYMTADYTGVNDFSSFEVINLKTGDISKIVSSYSISYNSYILGTVENIVYMYDKDNRLEYEINLRNKAISIVGEKDNYIKYYSKGEWIDLSINDFYEEQVFDMGTKDYINNNYVRIIKVGNLSGYYYLFKFVDAEYEVYRINIQDKSGLTYLFATTDCNTVIFLDDYIYYLDNNDLKYYSDKTGSRKVLTNTEFEFNKTIKFGVYEEK